LRAWGGDGAARVLRADAEHNAVLMNFLGWVGEGSYHLRDVLDLADRLHTCPVDTDAFPSLEANLARRVAWAAARFAESGDGPAARDVVEAEELLASLLAGSAERVLLHGDFQPKNVIVGEHGLGAVDPQPALGPDTFDVALWVVKCGHDHSLLECIGEVSDLRSEIDVELLRQWCWALSVLESRPYLGAVNNHRTDFIDLVRDLV
ncbi:MAG: aminoglycoside phosphotransferase family protein, partial [Nocardioides sp.]